jgi:hypothetical protein
MFPLVLYFSWQENFPQIKMAPAELVFSLAKLGFNLLEFRLALVEFILLYTYLSLHRRVFESFFRRHSEIIFSWQSFLMWSYLSLVCNSHTAQFQPIGKKGETAQGDSFPSRQGMFKRVYNVHSVGTVQNVTVFAKRRVFFTIKRCEKYIFFNIRFFELP